jgi:hypothetical protein
VLLECGITVISDCEILEKWLPKLFDSYKCCQVVGVTCEEDRVVILDLSKTETKKHIDGFIPMSIGDLDKLQQLYLQDNFLEGNLPLSLSNISSLQSVNISNNFLSGVIPFQPSFELIGIESNLDLSLPIDLSTIIESPTETQRIVSNINLLLIAGISASSLEYRLDYSLLLFSSLLLSFSLKDASTGRKPKLSSDCFQSTPVQINRFDYFK